MYDSIRSIQEIIEPQTVIEGAGVRLLRSIAPHRANRFDPFLLFDHFAFNDPREGAIAGFPTHPHRGIETVTYMLQGSVRHRDSLGNTGVIGAGDVQWMTSGRGILHEEMPRRDANGNIYGFQLWVNLPAALKMSQPRYQEVQASQIPLVERDGAGVRVVAGEYHSARGPVGEIAAQPVYMEVQLQPSARFSLPLPHDHTLLVYLFAGQAAFGEGNPDPWQGEPLSANKMLVFTPGTRFEAQTGPGSAARFMLMAGAP
ncbi:MAG: pirin family protein, partial [Chloroflexota bacterium]